MWCQIHVNLTHLNLSRASCVYWQNNVKKSAFLMGEVWQRRAGWFSAHIRVNFWRKNQCKEIDSTRDYANIYLWGHSSATFCAKSPWATLLDIHSRGNNIFFKAYAASKIFVTWPFMLLTPQHWTLLPPMNAHSLKSHLIN